MRLLLFKLNHLGDNVVFVPVIQALRERRPDWTLTVVTTPNERALYGGPLGAHHVLTSPKETFDKAYRRPWVLLQWLLRLRMTRPDACLIAFDQGTVAHLAAKASGARIRVGGNLEHIKVKGSLTHEVPMPDDQRPVTWNWRMMQTLAALLGEAGAFPEAPPPPRLDHLVLPVGAPPEGRRRIVVHPGSSRPINRWPAERFAAVARALARDHEVLWIVHGDARSAAPEGCLATAVTSLDAFASLVSSSCLFLGNNSGPMHLANALGCPGVAVTGSSALGWDPYWHPERWRALRVEGLACAPCESARKTLAGCANLAHPMACLDLWTAEAVLAACRDLLRSPVALRP